MNLQSQLLVCKNYDMKKSTYHSPFCLSANKDFNLSPQWTFPFSHVFPLKSKEDRWGHGCGHTLVLGCNHYSQS